MASTPHVVILGAGFGGLSAAKRLARTPARVTLVDRRNYHLFQPLLYQVATAGLSPGDIAYPIRSILRRQANVSVVLAEVTGVDPAAKKVMLEDGSLDYDHLIVATGARHSYFGHDQWESAAPGLKGLEDAIEIRRRILLAFERAEREMDPGRRRALLTFVLVGGGPTGAELAGAIGEISQHVLVSDFRSIDPREARILLIEAGPRILPAFPEDLARRAQQDLERLGVEVRVNSAVTDIGEGFVEVAGQRLGAATILWCAGVSASGAARSLGVPLDRAGRVLVGPDLSTPSHPEIFVIGDLAHFEQNGAPVPGVAPVAIQMGQYVAKEIRRRVQKQPSQAFSYWDKGSMATIGRTKGIAQIGKIHLSGALAWAAWLFIHLIYLIGFRNRFSVLLNWGWQYLRWQSGARLITGSDELPGWHSHHEPKISEQKKQAVG